MDWKMYEENRKEKENAKMYRTLCRVLAGIIAVICFLWYMSEQESSKTIANLREQAGEYESKIIDLNNEIYDLRSELYD